MSRHIPHGGDFSDLLARYPEAPRPLIDLSTGINPWPYPAGMPAAACCALPQARAEKECVEAMANYLGARAESVLLTPGTQIAISLLPLFFSEAQVAIAAPTYGEHAPAWRAHGHHVRHITPHEVFHTSADILLVTNPNNPDGRIIAPDRLLHLAQSQAARGGYLILDEAFADTAPEISLASHAGGEGLIILRSFGKFFGLAGLRLGAVLAPAALRAKLETALGPWAVSGPALAIAAEAYRNTAWIAATRARLEQEAARLDDILGGAGLRVLGGTSLYRLAAHEHAPAIHESLARAGIHTRKFDYEETWLRLGLPQDSAAQARLIAALSEQGEAPPSP